MLTYPPPHLAISKSDHVELDDLNVNQSKQKLLRRLKHLMNTSRKNLNKAQQRYKQNFDERVKPTTHVYRPGDLVFVRREANTSGLPDHKLRTEVTDALPIVRVNAPGRYVVVTLPDNTNSTVSFDRLSPVPPRLVPDKQTQNLSATPPTEQNPAPPLDLPSLKQTNKTSLKKSSRPPLRRSLRIKERQPNVHALRENPYILLI